MSQAEREFQDALLYTLGAFKTSLLYAVRRLEALEEFAMRQDPLYRVPELNDQEKDALAKAQEMSP